VIAVVLVGGEGTRLRPLTYTTPKPMLPIANRPFLEHQVEHLRAHGVDRIVLACGYKPDAIRAHFGSELEYVVEPKPLGTGGAIAYAAREAAISETFVACNGDVLTDLDLTALVAFHRDRRARMTIALHPVDDPSRYGVVATDDDGAVTAFIEKPPPGSTPVRTINAGTYVAEPDVLDLIPPGNAVSVEYDVFPRLVGDGLYALADEGAWRDIGTPESFLGANLERMPPGGLVDSTADVDPTASVERSVVGPDCRIGARARVRESVILAGALVAEGMTVDNQVVGRTGEPVW
jgi:mannose-1-phosphate guanylyltransferase